MSPVRLPVTVYHPDLVSGGLTSLGRQAKALGKGQLDAVLGFLSRTRYPVRNRVIFLLSSKVGLRAKEIARVRWAMLIDAEGEVSRAIHLQDNASKGRSGRAIPMHRQVRAALLELHREVNPGADDFVITTERSKRKSPQMIVNLFAERKCAVNTPSASLVRKHGLSVYHNIAEIPASDTCSYAALAFSMSSIS